MKKIIIPFLLSFLFLFGMMKVSAGTTLDTKQTSNGNISINFNFDEGYVGGIYATIQVTGDVSVSSIDWNSALAKEYTKKYSYQNGVITIIMTTGNSAKNLLTQNKQLNVGTLHFKNNSSTSQNYRLELKKVTIVDASYKSVEMTSIHTKQNQYQIAAKTEEPSEPSEPTKPTEPSKPTDPSNPGNSGNSNKPGSSTNPGNTGNQGGSNMSGSNTNQSGQLGSNDVEDKKDGDSSSETNDGKEETPLLPDQPNSEDKQPDLSTKDDTESNHEQQNVEKKGNLNYVLIGAGVLAGIIFIGIIVSIKKAH